jgi:hypothetical protein
MEDSVNDHVGFFVSKEISKRISLDLIKLILFWSFWKHFLCIDYKIDFLLLEKSVFSHITCSKIHNFNTTKYILKPSVNYSSRWIVLSIKFNIFSREIIFWDFPRSYLNLVKKNDSWSSKASYKLSSSEEVKEFSNVYRVVYEMKIHHDVIEGTSVRCKLFTY